VNKQLQGIVIPSIVVTPSTIEYEPEERIKAAKLFFECLDELDDL
jgi:hypothetical protein